MLNQQRFAATIVLVIGCSATPADPFPSGTTGGSTNTGGITGTGGAAQTGGTSATPTGGSAQSATGGTSTSTGGTTQTATGGTGTSTGGSGTSTGGTTGGSSSLTGGTTSTGGSGLGTGGTSGAGKGGTSSAGNGGASQTGGSAGATSSGGSGSTRPPTPSAGCGKGARPSGGVVTVDGDHIYTFPTNYDGTAPMPLVFGFHGANNPIDEIRNVAKGTDLEKNYVMAYLKSAGSGWVPSADNAHITKSYDELLANYCIDTSRVFATGHSSGAQLIVQMMCAGEKRFRAIAPVASSAYCSKWTGIPTFLIHNVNDSERASTSQDADGKKDLAPYIASSSCSMTTMPYDISTCKSTYNQATVDPGCVQYQGCTQPLVYCHHNDGNYSGTGHGWPCFASNGMAAFFAKQ